ncbi:MAG: transposase, partial [Cyanobacteria bacterium SW_9_44_58]
YCGMELQRDVNSGILIKKVGLGIASLKNAKSRKRDGEARVLSVG